MPFDPQNQKFKPRNVSEWIASIKELYSLDDSYENYREGYVYSDDGKEKVYAKDYHLWQAVDLVIIKKENPGTNKFLNEAVEHKRLDVLEVLLPNYYRDHGGVQAFASAIQNPERAAKQEVAAYTSSSFGNQVGAVQDFQRINQKYHLGLTNKPYKAWGDKELESLATNKDGIATFETLAKLAMTAKGTAANAKAAQTALGELTNQNWSQYADAILRIEIKTSAKRASIKQANPGLFPSSALIKDLSQDIGLNQVENPDFNAGETLKSKGIAFVSVDAGKKQPLETAVTDAVKGLPKGLFLM